MAASPAVNTFNAKGKLWLPPELQRHVVDYLDIRSTALATLSGWISPNLIPKHLKRRMRQARTWGTIFKPGTNWNTLFRDLRHQNLQIQVVTNLVVIGSDLQYPFYAQQRKEGTRPLHIVLLALGYSEGMQCTPCIQNYLRPWVPYGADIFIPSANIVLHCSQSMKARDLWKIGRLGTRVLSRTASSLQSVKISSEMAVSQVLMDSGIRWEYWHRYLIKIGRVQVRLDGKANPDYEGLLQDVCQVLLQAR